MWTKINPTEELSEVEIGNLPKKELKIKIMKMIKELGKKKKEYYSAIKKDWIFSISSNEVIETEAFVIQSVK